MPTVNVKFQIIFYGKREKEPTKQIPVSTK